MTRGRRPAEHPGFEASPTEDNMFRCLVCAMYLPFQAGNTWIQKKSLNKHKQSNMHQNSMSRRDAHEQQVQLLAAMAQESKQHIPMNQPVPQPTFWSPAVPPAMTTGEQEMWDQFETGQYEITVEDPEACHAARLAEFEQRVRSYNLWAGLEQDAPGMADLEGGDALQDEEELALLEVLEAIGVSETDSLAILNQETDQEKNGKWAPYPSKLLFLLDAIDNMPRLRVSNGLMNVILWLLREAGVKHVPKANAFRKFQASLRKDVGIETIHWTSPRGNAYSFNNPAAIVANDWSNPAVRPHIRRYPSLGNGKVSEIWDGEKWRRTLDRHALSPMYDDGTRHYFIDEPAKTVKGTVVIPIRWLEDDEGQVWFEAWEIEYDDNNKATILDADDQVVIIPARNLVENLLDLEENGTVPLWSQSTVDAGHPSRMPNPDRALAQGDPLYVSFIDVFGDDVSGNRSKSWNKHWNIYISHRNLPRRMLNKDSHIHFISTSPNATVPEQFQGIKTVVDATHTNPTRVYDPLTDQYIRFKLQCNCGPGDNPAQSEASGHIGGGGNKPCRKCMMGGTNKERTTDPGFEKIFSPGPTRSVTTTLDAVKSQVELACNGVAAPVSRDQTSTGVKDAYTQFWIDKLIGWARERQRSDSGRSVEEVHKELMSFVRAHPNELYNPFLLIKYCDITQDTLVEILHTILLGVVKYAWHGTHTSWKEGEESLYAQRLQSTDTTGLSIPSIRAGYIMQYANSLIGRQFKILAQVNAFHTYDLVTPEQYRLVKSVGVLSALLWFPEIYNMDEYLNDVNVAVANVLDSSAAVDPSKITTKIKYHLLTHVADDIKCFGPAVGVATEGYESFNGVFRLCSILSNHQAPSRDIALQLAKQEAFKHLASGGWWMTEGGGLAQPGFSLQNYIAENTVFQRLFNLPGHGNSKPPCGHTVLEALARNDGGQPMPRKAYIPAETHAKDALPTFSIPSFLTTTWYKCKSLISSSGDECKIGTWAFSRGLEGQQSMTYIGRVVEILRQEDGEFAFAVFERFEVSAMLHEKFDMPVLVRPYSETARVAVGAKDILFDCNVQHDCYTAGCKADGERAMKQERIDSGMIEKFVRHAPLDRFVINTHAFHNAHLLRSIPALRDLLKPRLLFPDRTEHHKAAALALRTSKEATTTPTEPECAVPSASSANNPRKRRRVEPQAQVNEFVLVPNGF